jgi:hypothetical protein
VDLVSNADGFGYLAYNGSSGGVSLDLDGSTGGGFSPAGEIQSVASLVAGDYTVSFLLRRKSARRRQSDGEREHRQSGDKRDAVKQLPALYALQPVL